jgi:type VI secretion system secreted protein Hcp
MGLAADFYLKVKAQKQGDIKGEVTQKGREGQILIYGWSWECNSPRDAQSGLPTGKRQHKPLVVRAPIGKASPLLAQALVTNENLKEVTLLGWRADTLHAKGAGTGLQKQYYTIKLTNANIAGIQQNFDGDTNHLPSENIAFTYQKIQWEYTDGGIVAMDDWETPNA